MDLLSVTENNEQQNEIMQQQSSLYSFMYALKSSEARRQYPKRLKRLFMYALKSSEARRQYPKRLKRLFDYLKLPASLEEQATEFINTAKTRENGSQWAQNSIMAFLDFHKERVRRKELAAGTLKNY